MLIKIVFVYCFMNILDVRTQFYDRFNIIEKIEHTLEYKNHNTSL